MGAPFNHEHWFLRLLRTGVMLAAALTSPLCLAGDEAAISRVLDTLHERAAAADFDGYFNLYHERAVFLGTDPTEHWTLEELKDYARPHFEQGKGWSYIPTERVIHTAGHTAWFEERLQHQRYGETRGTGVLLKTDEGWRIAQYNLTVPIPNDLFAEVARRISEHHAQQRGPDGRADQAEP